MKTPPTQPILLVSARPGYVHGTYEGQIIIHAQNLATSKSRSGIVAALALYDLLDGRLSGEEIVDVVRRERRARSGPALSNPWFVERLAELP